MGVATEYLLDKLRLVCLKFLGFGQYTAAIRTIKRLLGLTLTSLISSDGNKIV